MKVIAAKGTQCPKEANPREYITDAEAVEVPGNSAYYRRLVKDGSLKVSVIGDSDSKKQTQKADQKKGGKE